MKPSETGANAPESPPRPASGHSSAPPLSREEVQAIEEALALRQRAGSCQITLHVARVRRLLSHVSWLQARAAAWCPDCSGRGCVAGYEDEPAAMPCPTCREVRG